jgi:hypothetical protein
MDNTIAIAKDAAPVVERFVIAFPAGAAWVIVGLLIIIAGGIYFYGRWFLQEWTAREKHRDDRINDLKSVFARRMDSQDGALAEIKKSIASEVGMVKDMYHQIDKRLVNVEAVMRFVSKMPRRRIEDQLPDDD